MSDEKMKIPEDLKVWYSVACDGVHFQTDYAVIKTLIERIARTEAQLSLWNVWLESKPLRNK